MTTRTRRAVSQEEAFQQHDVLELFTVLLDALSTSVGGYATHTPASLFEFEMTDVLSYVLPDGGCIRRGRRVPGNNLSLFLYETTTSLEAAVQRYVSAETIDGFKTITASRKTMIIWLAVAHLCKKGISKEFPTQRALLNGAEASLERKAESLKTELAKIRGRKVINVEERTYFNSIVSFAESLAVDGDPRKSAFNLLLPIARAISSDQILKPASASKS